MNEILLPVEEEAVPLRPRPLPPLSSIDTEHRLRRQTNRINVSHSVSVTYSLILSIAALITVIAVLLFSASLPMEMRVWLGTVVGVLIVSLQIMLCIYMHDPVFAIHFIAILMLVTGVGFTLSALHLFYTHN